MQHLLVVIGKADVFQRNGIIAWQLFRRLRALHIFAGEHLRHISNDGIDLCNVIGVGESGDRRLHNSKGEDNDRQKCLCRQYAVHIEHEVIQKGQVPRIIFLHLPHFRHDTSTGSYV